jgi:hypothetical protein
MAVQAAKDGASNAKTTAEQMVPAAGRFLSRAVYTMSYSLSYGCVFPVAFIAKSLPSENAVMHGLIDGARAANDWVDELKHHKAELKHHKAEAPAPAHKQSVSKRGRPRTRNVTTKKKSGR